MRSSSPILLSAHDVALVNELVVWGARVKDIVWVVRLEEAELLARKLYEIMRKRPPNGPMGSATSRGTRLHERMQFAALATQYRDALERHTDRTEAMLAVYRSYFASLPPAHEGQLCVSVWMDLTRRLDTDMCGLVRCSGCGGRHVVDRDAANDLKSCMWCNQSMTGRQHVEARIRERLSV